MEQDHIRWGGVQRVEIVGKEEIGESQTPPGA